MAHFAEIDENNLVLRVLVVPDNQEHRGNDFLSLDLGLGGKWIQTSYNNNIRKNYAGKGYFYDKDLDAFIPPKPFNSWLLDLNTCRWKAPIEPPNDGEGFIWDETILNWKLVDHNGEN
jgi:hypothetical protein